MRSWCSLGSIQFYVFHLSIQAYEELMHGMLALTKLFASVNFGRMKLLDEIARLDNPKIHLVENVYFCMVVDKTNLNKRSQKKLSSLEVTRCFTDRISE
jgi:hypothetical protein